ncbi:MAG: metallopeptidase family protein [Chloroflexi bacterium]|nr:metallopeptidase family protein [Chloroflexota bacterium]
MNQEEFARLVARAVEDLPEEFLTRLENADVVVREEPTPSELKRTGLGRGKTLLGLYEGVPQTRRGSHYGMILPDKITIFQKPIEARCRNADEVYAVIKKTLRHEIAHHFGISDARLREIEEG